MKNVKVHTELVNKVASKLGKTPEQYIAESVSTSSGRVVCAHFDRTEGRYSIYRIN